MLRLGKRAMPMLRLGRSSTGTYTDQDIRDILEYLLGSNYDRESIRRQIPFPRYGKDLTTLFEMLSEQRSSPDYPVIDEDGPREIRPGPRPGRFRRSAPMPPQEIDSDEVKESSERAPPLPRIGKDIDEEGKVPSYDDQDNYIDSALDGYYYLTDKRGMPMLRLGRAMPMLRLGKRPFKMLRLGRGGDSELSDATDEDKRAMPMLRLGKRPFKMLRLGKRLVSDSDKRAMPMLRLGRSS